MGAPARVSRITIPVIGLALAATVALTGQGSTLSRVNGPALSPVEGSRSATPHEPDDKTIIHVLNRIGFGPAPGDVERVRAIGLDKYIEQQLHPDRLADAGMTARLSGLTTLTKSTQELTQDYFMPAQMERRRAQQQAGTAPGAAPPDPNPEATKREMRTPEQVEAMQGARQVLTDLAQQKILRAAYSERQLQEVMVDFWFNHFNVFAGKGQTRQYLTEYERDTIRPRVLGKFRDLLGAVAESPAMLFYLDNWQSSAPEGSRTEASMRPGQTDRARVRQGAGRRVLLPRATPRTMADLPPRPNQPNQRSRGLNENYARELMELHTLGVDGGYTQKDVQEVARALTGWTIAQPRLGGHFQYEPRMHDDGEKIVLGHRIKAGGGKKDGEQVLDILATHPSTATFVATKLARRFVADEPPPSLVERAAKRFRETDGDMREVVRTIVTSREFYAAEAYRAKVKTPFEFVVSAVRATGTNAVSGLPFVQALRELGMPPYQCQPPTGYADRADAWVNTGALLSRMNFAVSLTAPRGRGMRPGSAVISGDISSVRDTIIDGVLAGEISDATRSTVARATQPQQVVALLLGSPEFQKR